MTDKLRNDLRGCPRCGYVGFEYYCPQCKKLGFIAILKTAKQLRDLLDAMRRDAVILQRTIKRLEQDD